MLRRIVYALALAALAAVALAGAVFGEPAPYKRQQGYPKDHPAFRQGHPVVVVKEVVFLDAVDTVIDLNAKDVWVFTGPVRLYKGAPVGTYGDGSEARVGGDVDPAEEVRKRDATKADLKAGGADVLAASIKASCASCHQEGGKTRGGVALLDRAGKLGAKVNWKDVLDDVAPAKGDARMPPADSGKPALSKEAVEVVRLLAAGKSPPPPTEKKEAKAEPKAKEKAEPAGEVNAMLVAVVERSCLKCHGGDKTEAGLSFAEPLEVTAEQWRKAYRKVVKGEMPKGGAALSDEEAELFLDEALSAAGRRR